MQATNRQTADLDTDAAAALDEAADYLVAIDAILALPVDRQEAALQAREEARHATRAAAGWITSTTQIAKRTARKTAKAAHHEARYPAGYKPEPIPVPEIILRWAARGKVLRLKAHRHATKHGGAEEYCAWLAPGWRKAAPAGTAPRHYLAESAPEELVRHLRRLRPCDCERCARKRRENRQ